MMSGPLDGILVADFSRILAGPLATMFLGDFGADVIKVERPGPGDDARSWGPPFIADDSVYFHAINRNKRSVALDLEDAEDLFLARTLIARADVVVENFKPGTMDRLELGYDDMSTVNPGVIYCSISGFGLGPGASLVGYDFLVQAMGGLMSVTGPVGGPAFKAGMPVADVLAGLHAVAGIFAALYQRSATGNGQHVNVNLLTSLLSSLVNQTASYVNTGQTPVALGNRHPQIAPYETITVDEKTVALAVGNDTQFRALTRVLDIPDVADDPCFATNRDRVSNRPVLIDTLERAAAGRDADELVKVLTAAGVPAGPVNSIDEAVALAERLDLAPAFDLSDGDGHVSRQIRNPVDMSRSRPTYRLPPPKPGEHTDHIRRWLDDQARADPAMAGRASLKDTPAERT